MSVTINGTSGLVFNDASVQATAATGFGFKNRILNGSMMIDQRNNGASVTPTASTYTLDRWYCFMDAASKYSVQQSSTAPAGFKNSMLFTSTSAYTVGTGEAFGFRQMIEGFNVADLGWGTANAQSVTLSFWVRSSLTGTFGGVIRNSANTRTYPFTYTINSANTFEQKTVTIAGDTSGTWLTNNSVGIGVSFGLGVSSTISGTAGSWSSTGYWSATGATSVLGTSGATLYITGVQLEKGSTATSFDYRPYGTELALCQRYCFNVSSASGVPIAFFSAVSSSDGWSFIPFPVTPRVPPTGIVSVTSTWIMNSFGSGNTGNRALTFSSASPSGVTVQATGASTFVGGITGQLYSNGAAGQFYTTGSEL
jgi:hypothetical protein